jgi:uncharacterized protein (TIRG00374 family)
LALLKLAVSGVLVALVVRRFSFAGIKAELAAADPAALVWPFAILVAGNVLAALQWHWLTRSAGVEVRFLSMLRAYFIGLFLNNFMLGSVGGDVFKVVSIGRGAGLLGRVAGATIVDRMVALSALCALAFVAAVTELRGERVPLEQTLLVAGFSLAVLTIAGVLLHARHGEAAGRLVARLPLGRWSDKLRRLMDYLHEYRERPGVLNGAFLLSLAIQASRVVAHFCVGLALGWSLHATDLLKFLLVIPILGLVAALPISLGGWGVREWAGIALFAPLGHGGQEAVALLALTATLSLVASMLGALVLVAVPDLRSRPGASPA